MFAPPPPPKADNRPTWANFVAAKKSEPRPAPKNLVELRAAALERLGGHGDTWADRLPQIDQWWAQMKEDEKKVTWESAFRANRMTVRAITISREARYGCLEVSEKDNPEDMKKFVFLHRDPESMADRLVPENFLHKPGEKSPKNSLGLHAQSASLLHSGYPLKEQVKFYANAVTMFFPAPSPQDMQIFDAISHLPGADEVRLIDMRARMTRMEGAWHGDMHTTLTYSGASNDQLFDPAISVRYGLAGTWKDQQTNSLRKAGPEELAARYLYALQHGMILDHPSEPVNEVVMSYRQHNSPVFPLYAVFAKGQIMICKPTRTPEYADVIDKLQHAWRTEGGPYSFYKPDPTHTVEMTGDHINADGEYVRVT